MHIQNSVTKWKGSRLTGCDHSNQLFRQKFVITTLILFNELSVLFVTTEIILLDNQ